MISIQLNFEDFFDQPEDIDDLLKSFNKDDLFKICALLNSKVKLSQSPSETIIDWFSSKKCIDSLLKKVPNGQFHIINIISNLLLLSFINDCHSNNRIEDANVFELNLFKIYLLLNSKQDKIEKSLKKLEIDDPEEKLSALIIQMTFHYDDLISYNIIKIFISQLIKSIEFLKYIEDRYPQHLNRFLQNYKCNNIKDWIKELTNLILPILKHDNNKFSEQEIDDKRLKDVEPLLNLLSNEIEYLEKPDFVTLRSKPLYRANKNRYIIINKLFLIERIFKSITFEFSRDINEKVSEKYRVKNFRSQICHNFSEKIIFYKFVKKSFPNNLNYIKIEGEEFSKKKYKGGPDYYLRFKNKILLFESKDVIIKGEIKESRDYNLIKESLISKFYKEGTTQNKAILQLIENIKKIFNNHYDLDVNYKTNLIRIYPIIVTHDRQFDSPEINNLVNKWFTNELKINFTCSEIERIYNVTIINIDSFLLHYHLFHQRGKFSLEILIEKYHNYVKRTFPLSKQNYLNKAISFSNFLDNEIGKSKIKALPDINEYMNYLYSSESTE